MIPSQIPTNVISRSIAVIGATIMMTKAIPKFFQKFVKLSLTILSVIFLNKYISISPTIIKPTILIKTEMEIIMKIIDKRAPFWESSPLIPFLL